MKKPPPNASSRGAPLRFLGAVCALVIAVFWGSAHSGLIELLGGAAAQSPYNLLVEGFQDGGLSLRKAVPPALLQLADPYDPAANQPYRIPPTLADDLSLYRGRFYLYFGVTPALLLFWPWAAVTGHFVLHRWAVAAFCSSGFLASVALLRAFWRRYFPEIAPGVAAACALALGLATSAPILLQRSEVYEVSISCAYALTMIALCGIWRALHRPAERARWLAAASLAFGLAVGARPPVLFSAVILAIPVAAAWRNADRRRDLARLVAAAAGPLALCGLGLAVYNALRFGSPFEFGQHYQLSGIRQDNIVHFSPAFLAFNFRVYFLEPMRWHWGFPFVRNIVPPALPPGHGIVEEPFHPFGVLTNIPWVWLAAAAPLACAPRRNAATGGNGGPHESSLPWFLLAAALLFVIPAAVTCLFFGTCSRYEMEFLPALALLATAGVFGLERRFAGRPALLRGVRLLWIALLAFSAAFNLLASCERYAVEHGYFGHSLYNLGRTPEALSELGAALRMDPGMAGAHEDLGVALARSGRLADAMEEFRATLRLDPGRADAHDNLGNGFAQSGQVAEAIAEYREALRLRPDSAAAHYNLAVALQQAGRKVEAIDEYREAVRLNPGLAPRSP
jgi:hypothetical protein